MTTIKEISFHSFFESFDDVVKLVKEATTKQTSGNIRIIELNIGSGAHYDFNQRITVRYIENDSETGINFAG